MQSFLYAFVAPPNRTTTYELENYFKWRSTSTVPSSDRCHRLLSYNSHANPPLKTMGCGNSKDTDGSDPDRGGTTRAPQSSKQSTASLLNPSKAPQSFQPLGPRAWEVKPDSKAQYAQQL